MALKRTQDNDYFSDEYKTKCAFKVQIKTLCNTLQLMKKEEYIIREEEIIDEYNYKVGYIKKIDESFDSLYLEPLISNHIKIKNIFKIFNEDCEEQFNLQLKKMKHPNIKQLYSYNIIDNISDIIKNGFDTRSIPHKYLYGKGLYFTDNPLISIIHGNKQYLFVCSVICGTSYEMDKYSLETMNIVREPKDYDSIKGFMLGSDNNYIVYKNNFIKIDYIIEIDNVDESYNDFINSLVHKIYEKHPPIIKIDVVKRLINDYLIKKEYFNVLFIIICCENH